MSQDIRQKIAQKVKFYREKRKINKEELSLSLGFDNSYISKLEKEKVNITIDRLAKIADYLKVEPFELLK